MPVQETNIEIDAVVESWWEDSGTNCCINCCAYYTSIPKRLVNSDEPASKDDKVVTHYFTDYTSLAYLTLNDKVVLKHLTEIFNEMKTLIYSSKIMVIGLS